MVSYKSKILHCHLQPYTVYGMVPNPLCIIAIFIHCCSHFPQCQAWPPATKGLLSLHLKQIMPDTYVYSSSLWQLLSFWWNKCFLLGLTDFCGLSVSPCPLPLTCQTQERLLCRQGARAEDFPGSSLLEEASDVSFCSTCQSLGKTVPEEVSGASQFNVCQVLAWQVL